MVVINELEALQVSGQLNGTELSELHWRVSRLGVIKYSRLDCTATARAVYKTDRVRIYIIQVLYRSWTSRL